jgi:hypothetical protein
MKFVPTPSKPLLNLSTLKVALAQRPGVRYFSGPDGLQEDQNEQGVLK